MLQHINIVENREIEITKRVINGLSGTLSLLDRLVSVLYHEIEFYTGDSFGYKNAKFDELQEILTLRRKVKILISQYRQDRKVTVSVSTLNKMIDTIYTRGYSTTLNKNELNEKFFSTLKEMGMEGVITPDRDNIILESVTPAKVEVQNVKPVKKKTKKQNNMVVPSKHNEIFKKQAKKNKQICIKGTGYSTEFGKYLKEHKKAGHKLPMHIADCIVRKRQGQVILIKGNILEEVIVYEKADKGDGVYNFKKRTTISKIMQQAVRGKYSFRVIGYTLDEIEQLNDKFFN